MQFKKHHNCKNIVLSCIVNCIYLSYLWLTFFINTFLIDNILPFATKVYKSIIFNILAVNNLNNNVLNDKISTKSGCRLQSNRNFEILVSSNHEPLSFLRKLHIPSYIIDVLYFSLLNNSRRLLSCFLLSDFVFSSGCITLRIQRYENWCVH